MPTGTYNTAQQGVRTLIQPQTTYEQDHDARLHGAIAAGQEWLLDRQAVDGHWRAELEGDTILESEYLIYLHYCDLLNAEVARKAGNYIRSKLLPAGGVPIYPAGPMELSANTSAIDAPSSRL